MRGIRNFFRHYFTPHHSNNYKARTLHPAYFVVYLLFLLGVQNGSHFVTFLNPNILGYATNISTDRILELVNKERVKNELTPLTLSNELSSAATNKATDMFKYDYWAHVSPKGTTPWEFITGSGYRYTYAGENLAKSFDTSDDVFIAWMNSPSHKANLLKPEYREIGIAVMNGKLQGDTTTLVVQEFGARNTVVVADLPKVTTVPVEPKVQIVADNSFVSNNGSVQSVTSKIASAFSSGYTKRISLFMAQFLLVVLLFDAIYIWKFKTVRISGHSLAHIIFIATLIGAMGATGIGAIL